MRTSLFKQVDRNNDSFNVFQHDGVFQPLVVTPFIDGDTKDNVEIVQLQESLLSPYIFLNSREVTSDYPTLISLLQHGRRIARKPRLTIVTVSDSTRYYYCKFVSGVVSCGFKLSLAAVFTSNQDLSVGDTIEYRVARLGSESYVELRIDHERETETEVISYRDYLEHCDSDVNILDKGEHAILTKSLLRTVLQITFDGATLPLDCEIFDETINKIVDIA